MHSPPRSLIYYFGAFCIIAIAITLFLAEPRAAVTPTVPEQPSATTSQAAGAAASDSASWAAATNAESVEAPRSAQEVVAPEDPLPAPDAHTVQRIEDPYPFPALSASTVNISARLALVNILCSSGSGGMRPISGSGVIIDPRGIILTNAHVAQYVLLSQSPRVDIACDIRYGTPARPLWSAEVLYMPEAWVREHAADIVKERPTGTGEHDWALLRISGARTGAAVPASFPYLSVDTRNGIAFLDDTVLAVSYPAEFIGPIAAQFDLYPASSLTTVRDLLTFSEDAIDLISLGGIISAQSGSSGGAVVNLWGRLVGIISTTSSGATTGERDLRAITLAYIDSDVRAQTGDSLERFLSGDVAAKAAGFRANSAPELLRLLIAAILGQGR